MKLASSINTSLQSRRQDVRAGGGARRGSEDVLGGELLAGRLLLPQAVCAEVLSDGSQGQLHGFPHRLWRHLGLVPCSLGENVALSCVIFSIHSQLIGSHSLKGHPSSRITFVDLRGHRSAFHQLALISGVLETFVTSVLLLRRVKRSST